tara:strand:- start:879 stop:1352 length:474 start_codon:yes stop_codon:yes gene_type:complete
MIDQIYTFFTIDMIYIWLTLGVLPLWILLIFFPQIKITKIFVTSIFPLIFLAAVNSYLIFTIYRNEINYLDAFNLYLNFDELLILFSDKNFAILFWIHFLAINLFCGSWIVRDYQKINMPKFLAFFPLIITYFTGPIGLSIYWFLRIFYSKKIDMYD